MASKAAVQTPATSSIFLRKLPVPHANFILETTWYPLQQQLPTVDACGGTKHVVINLKLVNMSKSAISFHSGHVSQAALTDWAERLEIPVHIFYAETKVMLTEDRQIGDDDSSSDDYDSDNVDGDSMKSDGSDNRMPKSAINDEIASYLFDLESVSAENIAEDVGAAADTAAASGNASVEQNLRLTWRRRKSAHLTCIYGSVMLRALPDASVGELMLRTVDSLARRSAQYHRMRNETEALRRSDRKLRMEFEKCVNRKLELEHELLHKFMSVLNEKKKRIRQLEGMLADDDDKPATASTKKRRRKRPSNTVPPVARVWTGTTSSNDEYGDDDVDGDDEDDDNVATHQPSKNSSQMSSVDSQATPTIDDIAPLPRRTVTRADHQQPSATTPPPPATTTASSSGSAVDPLASSAGMAKPDLDPYECDTQDMIVDMI